MKFENQVCSLELAQKLKELGVPQESYFFWISNDGETEWFVRNTFKHMGIAPQEIVSAYTVAELGEMLRKRDIYLIPVSIEGFWTGIDAKKQKPVQLGSVEELTEADARAKMLIYLLESKLITL